MPTRVRNSYRPNRAGVVGILTSNPMRAALALVGQQAAEIARDIAPVETGRYRESFKVSLGTRGRGNKKRAIVTVKNTAPYAASLEFGTRGRARPQRILGRTQSRMRVAGYVR